jgi:hypothetical protein
VSEDLSLNGRMFVSGNVGIGTTNPQSALDVSGAIRVSGGITPTYSSPSFSAGQIGEIITDSVGSTTISVNSFYSRAVTIPAGVWIMTAQWGMINNGTSSNFIMISTSSTGALAINDPNQGYCNWSSTINTTMQVNLTRSLTSSTTYYWGVFFTGSSSSVNGWFKAIRIA